MSLATVYLSKKFAFDSCWDGAMVIMLNDIINFKKIIF